MGGIVRDGGDGEGCGGEVGGVALIASHHRQVGVVGGVAVVPAEEDVAWVGDGLEVGHGAVAVGGRTFGGAHGGVGRADDDVVHVGLEEGGEGAAVAVAAHGHVGLGGGGDAVGPAVEGVVVQGGGGDLDAVAHGDADGGASGVAGEGHGAAVGVGGCDGEGDAVAHEDGLEHLVGVHGEADGVGVGEGIATPLYEVDVLGGLGYDVDLVAVFEGAEAGDSAEGGVVVGGRDGELGKFDEAGDDHAFGAGGESEGVGVAASGGGADFGVPAEGVVVGVVHGGGDGDGLAGGDDAAGGRGGDGAEQRVVEGAEDHGLVLGAEVGDEGGVAADGVGVVGGGGAVGPTDEFVAFVGGGGEVEHRSVGMATGVVADGAEEGVDGVDGDGVGVGDEDGGVEFRGGLGCEEEVARVVGVVVGPAGELIVGIGNRTEGGGGAHVAVGVAYHIAHLVVFSAGGYNAGDGCIGQGRLGVSRGGCAYFVEDEDIGLAGEEAIHLVILLGDVVGHE